MTLRNLIIKSISCDSINIEELKSLHNKDINHLVVLEISPVYSKEEADDGVNLFYFNIVTPESLLANADKSYILVKNRTIVLSYFDYEKFINSIQEIVSSCCRDTWEDSINELLKYFEWEYENYK